MSLELDDVSTPCTSDTEIQTWSNYISTWRTVKHTLHDVAAYTLLIIRCQRIMEKHHCNKMCAMLLWSHWKRGSRHNFQHKFHDWIDNILSNWIHTLFKRNLIEITMKRKRQALKSIPAPGHTFWLFLVLHETHNKTAVSGFTK